MNDVDGLKTDADWLLRASSAAERAYSPYSRVKVGCVLQTAAGRWYDGCNVENASYGLTICAERNAVFAAVAAEGPEMKILRVAVVAVGHEFPPCGACRQVMAEFASPDAEILFLQNGTPVCLKITELLPAAFDAAGLRG